MRVRAALLIVLATATVVARPAATDDFKTLYEARRWFELRDAVSAAADAPALYRGAVAYAFHEWSAAEKILRAVAVAQPESPDAIEARSLLINVAQMRTEYRDALAEIHLLQGIVADAKELENGAAFFDALARFPPQRMTKKQRTTVSYTLRGGNLFVPVAVNGRPGHCIVDTGANFSTIAEGDARRDGLTIHDAPGSHGNDAAGTRVAFRLALAERLSVGGVELRNVVFLVARDDQQPFVDLPAGSRSVLGIPALVAFGSIRWHDDGRFDIVPEPPAGAIRDANLCFDGANPMALGDFQGKRLDVFLDTGATRTRLMPPFARDFPDSVRSAKRASTTVRGVGGSATVDAAVIDRVVIRLGGRDLPLAQADVLLKDLGQNPASFHVWAGFDLFRSARSVTVDFRAMKLSVE